MKPTEENDRENIIYFSKDDAVMFINLLDHPSKPNAALLRAFERFKQREIENDNQTDSARDPA